MDAEHDRRESRSEEAQRPRGFTASRDEVVGRFQQGERSTPFHVKHNPPSHRHEPGNSRPRRHPPRPRLKADPSQQEDPLKTSRRGGLGRGLGALIQSTAEPVDEAPQEADATAEDATAPTAAPAEKKAATSTARRLSKETSEAKTPAPRAASASKSSGGAAKEAPADKKAGSAGRAPAAAKKATPTKKASSSAGEAKANSAAAPAAARKTPDRAAQRPVDVFFSPDPEDAPAARRGTKARPAMPTVKAPTKREAASSSGEEAAAGAPTAAEGTVSTDIAVLREIPVGDIHPNPRQPREVFDEEHMAELVTSIREVSKLCKAQGVY